MECDRRTEEEVLDSSSHDGASKKGSEMNDTKRAMLKGNDNDDDDESIITEIKSILPVSYYQFDLESEEYDLESEDCSDDDDDRIFSVGDNVVTIKSPRRTGSVARYTKLRVAVELEDGRIIYLKEENICKLQSSSNLN